MKDGNNLCFACATFGGFTETQIAFAIKQRITGTRVEDVCCKMGVSEATFYNWKKKYSGLRLQNNPFVHMSTDLQNS